jgi:aminoglycoside phosphotransferase (APT) family kinase protein
VANVTGMASAGIPDAEVDLTEELVHGLIAEQHPDLSALSIQLHSNGWDNAMFRLGDDLAVRIPRRARAADLIVNEITWLPQLAPRLPLAVPAAVRVGRPNADFPWSWAIVPWFDGDPVGVEPFADPAAAAATVGSFVAAMHHPAPPDAPRNPVRGIALAARVDVAMTSLPTLSGQVDVPRVQANFLRAADAPAWAGPPLWLHGDLHPFNILQRNGTVCAVIDFGDMTSGDPATDLMIGWSLFDEPERTAFRLAADTPDRPIDEAMWERSRGWAIALAIALLAYGHGVTWQQQVGHRILASAII